LAAKKKYKEGELASILEEYKERILGLIADFIEQETKNLENWIKSVTHLKQKIKRSIVALSMLIAGVTLIFFGLGEYIAINSGLPNHLGYMIVGFVAIIAAIAYNKM